MPIEVSVRINIEPDKHGVYDGREIARGLVRMAFEATIPYAHGCGGCADKLFSAIAENGMADLHAAGLHGSTYAVGDEATKPGRFHAHAADTLNLTASLMGLNAPASLGHATAPEDFDIGSWVELLDGTVGRITGFYVTASQKDGAVAMAELELEDGSATSALLAHIRGPVVSDFDPT